jgi:hypothetical protein
MSRARFTTPLIALSMAIGLIALAGCGGSSSNAPSEAQLEAAKRQGEEAAREKDRIDSLQKQVRGLKRQAKHKDSTVVVEHDSGVETTSSAPSGSVVLRTFHAPSGNVSCEILSNGALCSVDSISTTFAFSDGQAGRIESGASLPESAGELVSYGGTVSAGAVTCAVPLSSEPRGITCVDNESGHGFEASRVSDRQHAY